MGFGAIITQSGAILYLVVSRRLSRQPICLKFSLQQDCEGFSQSQRLPRPFIIIC